jgi:hypothetical protein
MKQQPKATLRQMPPFMKKLCLITLLVLNQLHCAVPFTVQTPTLRPAAFAFQITTRLHASPSSSAEASSSAQPDITAMSTSDMRKELESYGISTKSFLERSDMVQALNKARANAKQPTTNSADNDDNISNATTASTSISTDDEAADEKTANVSKSRSERIQEEMAKAKSMKVGALKAELEERGISTRSFFEKTEFVRAYAEAIVDNVSKNKASGSSSASAGKSKATSQDEPYDPSYRDVTIQKFDARDPRLLSGVVIDVKLGR